MTDRERFDAAIARVDRLIAEGKDWRAELARLLGEADVPAEAERVLAGTVPLGPCRVVRPADGELLYPSDSPIGRVTAEVAPAPSWHRESAWSRENPQVWVRLRPSFRGLEYDLTSFPPDWIIPATPEEAA